MARTPRKFTVKAGFSVHKVWRGHNREWNLETAEQKERYLELMNEDLKSKKYQAGSIVEALTLMSNHTHELSGVQSPELYSNHMRRHHSRYGRYLNDAKERCGKVAQDRPHTTLIGDDYHHMMCTLYIHANPHRAKIPDAENYEYSTHKLYAYGKRSAWMKNITLPKWYRRLGKNSVERQTKYRKLFAKYIKDYGLTKLKFLKARFYGSVEWVSNLESAVTKWRNSRVPAAPS
jgi:putative transposase